MTDGPAITIRLTFAEAEELRMRLTKAADGAVMLSRSFLALEDRASSDDDASDIALLRTLAGGIGNHLNIAWSLLDQAQQGGGRPQ